MPYHDLSAEAIGVSGASRIDYVTRKPGVVCGAEEVRRLAELLGIAVESAVKSGSRIEAGETLLSATGESEAIFALWKVGQNLLDRSSGIASAARAWRDRLDGAGFDIPILVTRKILPGAKKLMTKAALLGGAVSHRLGVSETILFFDQHVAAAGGEQSFLERLPRIKCEHIEKKILVETADPAFIEAVLQVGADGIQFDKLSAAQVAEQTRTVRDRFDGVFLLAAGGISFDNCVDYAETGVDGLVTSAVYQAPPLDIGVRIQPL